MVSRCFPGGYNVKLYISRGRLAWWLLAFLFCDCSRNITQTDQGYAWVILTVVVISFIITSSGFTIMGVLMLELASVFDVSALELNAAATMQYPVSLLACKYKFYPF